LLVPVEFLKAPLKVVLVVAALLAATLVEQVEQVTMANLQTQFLAVLVGVLVVAVVQAMALLAVVGVTAGFVLCGPVQHALTQLLAREINNELIHSHQRWTAV
jgi:sulfite exporter TauE/SafE